MRVEVSSVFRKDDNESRNLTSNDARLNYCDKNRVCHRFLVATDSDLEHPYFLVSRISNKSNNRDAIVALKNHWIPKNSCTSSEQI